MRPREERRGVVITSRLRCGMHWLDARIINLSSRGIGLTAAAPPQSGTYVEIRRGPYVIVARVMWVNGLRFGVRTQNPVPIDSLVRQPNESVAPGQTETARLNVERRVARRSLAHKHDRSRTVGRAFEFACVTLVGMFAAFVGFSVVKQALEQPLEAVQKALLN